MIEDFGLVGTILFFALVGSLWVDAFKKLIVIEKEIKKNEKR